MQGNKKCNNIQIKLLLSGLAALLLAFATVLVLFFLFFGLYERVLGARADGVPQELQGRYPVQEFAQRNNLPGMIPAGAGEEGKTDAAGSFFLRGMTGAGQLLLPAGLVLLVVLLFSVYYLLLTKRHTQYIRELSEGIGGFAGGQLSHRVRVQGTDELAVMAENLNSMADELHQMMEHDRSVEARKTELVTNVAHDLRTPLTSILGYLGLANREDISQEQRISYVTTAYEKAKRLEKLIEDLFEYSKMTFGAVRMECKELDVIYILQQLLEEFYPSFEKSGLSLDFYYTDKNATVYADGNLLARAFANLIGNAIKYGADGKRVELSLQQTTTEVTVRIVNFGKIIPKEALEHIFERFYRVDSSRSEQTGGSGLGLTIAKSIIEMHHGTICVTSDLDGTVFLVTLPKKDGDFYEAKDDMEQ